MYNVVYCPVQNSPTFRACNTAYGNFRSQDGSDQLEEDDEEVNMTSTYQSLGFANSTSLCERVPQKRVRAATKSAPAAVSVFGLYRN